MKYKIYNTIFNIINESIDIYKDNSCFIEYFTPIFESLNAIDQKNFKNINIRKQKKEIVNKLYNFLIISKNNRQPVCLQKDARKAEAIKEFVYIINIIILLFYRIQNMKKNTYQERTTIQINKKPLKNNLKNNSKESKKELQEILEKIVNILQQLKKMKEKNNKKKKRRIEEELRHFYKNNKCHSNRLLLRNMLKHLVKKVLIISRHKLYYIYIYIIFVLLLLCLM